MAGAVIGAVVMAFVAVVFSYLGSGPDHTEWMDSAVVMGPIAAVFGLIVGALAGLLVGGFGAMRVTRRGERRGERQRGLRGIVARRRSR